jgi:hypothetical protein
MLRATYRIVVALRENENACLPAVVRCWAMRVEVELDRMSGKGDVSGLAD